MAIWITQFVGREIRLLDYIEGVGQPLAYYAHELRRRSVLSDRRAHSADVEESLHRQYGINLPHDGVATNNITGKRYIDHWTEAGFECGTLSRILGGGSADAERSQPVTVQGHAGLDSGIDQVARRFFLAQEFINGVLLPPWVPFLEEERRLDLQLYPERYAHIWEGEYARAFEGACLR